MKFTSTYLLLLLIFGVSQGMAQTDTLSFAKVQKLGEKVNSSAEESLPILSPDGKVLYFTRTYHPGNMGGTITGADIWQSNVVNGQYESARNMSEFNTKYNDALVGSARGGKRLYLLNKPAEKRGRLQAGISRSDFDEASSKWGPPVAVPVPGLEVEGNFYSAYVATNEDYILFSLPENGMDTTNNLYVSTSPDKGESWTSPVPITSLNTSDDEISPFYDESRGLLFWSSNGREGYGGYDIFYARRLDDSWTNWSEPVNAGPEINSAKFDAYFFVSPDGTAWLSSNRGDSLSNLFLSSVVNKTLEDELTEDMEDVVESIDAQSADKNPAQKDPVLIIDTKDGSSSDRSLRDLSLEELLDKDTHIRFVYFPYDKYNITAKYIEVLDDIGLILDQYPAVKVRIEGHTDNVGSQAYNMVLSENRAQSTKEYLLIHGVDDARIQTRAYGKLQPYSSNETDEGRALNRRVELYFNK